MASLNPFAAFPKVAAVHPLVLLSVVDHYKRVANNNPAKRVVGALLGQWTSHGVVNISSSFAIPFEEEQSKSQDAEYPDIWFLDHNYLENMYMLSKKVTAKERIVGWYHTGPQLNSTMDLAINQLIRKYTANPVLIVVNVQESHTKQPTTAYLAIDEISHDVSTVYIYFSSL